MADQLNLVFAQQARQLFRERAYVDAIKIVNEAILDSARKSTRVVVDIPTGIISGGGCTAALVSKRLSEHGFDVIMHHDHDNGSSELTISW